MIPVYLGQQTISQTGTTKGVWQLAGKQTRLKGGFLHACQLVLDIKIVETSAATASAIALIDWILYLARVRLIRGSGNDQIASLLGWSCYQHAALTNRGDPRQVNPAVVAANANAGTTRYYRVVFAIGDDKECAPSVSERYARAWPVAAYAGGKGGRLEIDVNPTLPGSTGLTFTDGTGTIDAYFMCDLRPTMEVPYDVRYEEVANSGTGTVKDIKFPAGTYESIWYSPYKLGGQDLTAATIDGSKYAEKDIFPLADAIGYDIANAYVSGGLSYQERWLQTEGRDQGSEGDATNEVLQNRCAPLWGFRAGVPWSRRCFVTDGFSLDMVSGTAITNGHLFGIGRLFPTDPADIDAMSKECCVATSAVVRRPALPYIG